MKQFLKRIQSDFAIARALRHCGVTMASIAQYPVRKRRGAENHLQLENGVSLTSSPEEQLLSIFQEVWVDRCYAVPGYTIASGDTIVDIGANIGTFTLWAASHAPNLRIIAVEPSPDNLRYLRMNLSESKVSGVTVVPACCGAANGEIALRSRGSGACNTIYSKDNYGSEFKLIAQCQMLTLDQIFADHAIESCNLLKLDCEGAEYEILQSASTDTLFRIQNVAMEYHVGMNEFAPEALASLLEQHGFKVDRQPLRDEEGGYLLATRQTSPRF